MAEILVVVDYKFSKVVRDYPIYSDVRCYPTVMSVSVPYHEEMGHHELGE